MKKKTLGFVLLVVMAMLLTLVACRQEPVKYDIRFVNDNGEELKTISVEENGAVVYDGETPAKEATAEFNYEFAGWADEKGVVLESLPKATQNAIYTARYTSVKRSYTVKFVSEGVELQSETLAWGVKPEYKGEALQKQSTASQDFAFAGWAKAENGETVDLANETVVSDATYYAVFTASTRNLNVTWNIDGTQTQTAVPYGGNAVFEGTVSKDSDEDCSYAFSHWSLTENGEAVDLLHYEVTQDVVFYAVFTPTQIRFTVTWHVSDSEETAEFAALNSAPSYKGDISAIVKAPTEAVVYTFIGWSRTDGGEVVDLTNQTVTGDVTYYAVFEESERTYTVTWIIDGQTSTTSVGYNKAPAHSDASKDSTELERYIFTGWSRTEGGEVINLADERVTNTVTYYAVFRTEYIKFPVSFMNGSTELQSSYVDKNGTPVYEGETPVKDPTPEIVYIFAGWSKDGSSIVNLSEEVIDAATTYYALFTSADRTYTLHWNVRGTVTTESVTYNTVPEFKGEAPANYSDDDYNYTFIGWSQTEGGETLDMATFHVVEDTTLYACYSKAIKQYTLTIRYQYEDKTTAFADKTLTLDKYTIYGREDTLSPTETSGKLPDKMWVAGRLTEDTVVVVTYKATDVWDGTVATAFASGTGTEEDPYIIMTGAQLAYLSELSRGTNYGSGLYFKLGASIDLSGYDWTPICQRANVSKASGWNAFAGTFDGAGYTVKLKTSNTSYIGAALFEGLSGKVTDLVLAGSINGAHRAGALVYTALSGAVVENVINFADVSVQKDNSGSSYTGGVIGISASANITNTVNYGIVNAAGQYVGGVLGYDVSSTIENCGNFGHVTGGKYTGGILGGANTKGKTATTIKNSSNFGVVNGTNNGVGGIVGGSTGALTLESCTNYGTVYGANAYVGGIIGHCTTVTITDCINYGIVTVSDGTTPSGSNKGFGGIAGYSTNNTTIANCHNYGTVDSYTNVGGITGYLGAGSTVDEQCTNNGSINGQDTVGELVGYDANE